MFKRIQKIFLLKNTKNYLENRTTRNINDSLTTIGFLVNEEVNIDFEKFFEISRTLGVHQKDVKIFSFLDFKTKTPTLIQNRIYSNHFNWRGQINNSNALDFLTINLDVLVGYYKTKNEYEPNTHEHTVPSSPVFNGIIACPHQNTGWDGTYVL